MWNWVLDGGRVSVDLVNTVRDRYAEPVDLLDSPAALGEWLVLTGLTPHRPATTAADLQRARELREAVDRTLLATGRRPRAADVRLVNDTAAAAPAVTPQLHYTAAGGASVRQLRPRDPVGTALATIAVDAIELAASDIEVRQCAAHDCGLRFADTSRKRDRQWCSMARCGNRAKARKHYARTRRATSVAQ